MVGKDALIFAACGVGRVSIWMPVTDDVDPVIELYHSINSVCAQKVRIALAEKGLSYKEHLMRLGGDQFDPAYMRLNPNAVLPTLIHDGQVVIESSVILYYLTGVLSAHR